MKPSICVVLVSVLLAACGGGTLTPPPPPLRPKAKPVEKPPEVAKAPEDCEPTDPDDKQPSKSFDQRSIPEAERLAKESVEYLNQANTDGIDRKTKEGLIEDAVKGLITALLADPYNVTATYKLAAAYARIDRPQCAINLLERLLLMKDHASRKDAVEGRLDELLGRKKKPLDPDFADMRGDARFRALIARMCEGSADPACVFGQ
jgi:hypothetical protein